MSRPAISEGGGVSSTLTVFRAGDAASPLEPSLLPSGTAVSGLHLAALPDSIHFAANQDQEELEITAIDNGQVHPARWLGLTLAPPPSPYLLAPDHTVRLTLLDDDVQPFHRLETCDIGDPPTTDHRRRGGGSG